MHKEHDERCHYCRVWLPAALRTWDHIVPRAMGGPNGYWNRVTSCAPCNNTKGDTWSMCLCETCFAAKLQYSRNYGKKFRSNVEKGRIRDNWFEFLD